MQQQRRGGPSARWPGGSCSAFAECHGSAQGNVSWSRWRGEALAECSDGQRISGIAATSESEPLYDADLWATAARVPCGWWATAFRSDGGSQSARSWDLPMQHIQVEERFKHIEAQLSQHARHGERSQHVEVQLNYA